jgi:hypothetical protein
MCVNLAVHLVSLFFLALPPVPVLALDFATLLSLCCVDRIESADDGDDGVDSDETDGMSLSNTWSSSTMAPTAFSTSSSSSFSSSVAAAAARPSAAAWTSSRGIYFHCRLRLSMHVWVTIRVCNVSFSARVMASIRLVFVGGDC